MKTIAPSGLVYIAVSVGPQGFCKIGRAVGRSAEAQMRQWVTASATIARWQVFTEHVSDASACEAEIRRMLDGHRDTVKFGSRETFPVRPDEAKRILQLAARNFPARARSDESDGDAGSCEPPSEPTASARIVSNAEGGVRGVPDQPGEVVHKYDPRDEHGQGRVGSDRSPPMLAAVIHDPYRWISAALVLLVALVCAKVGLPAIVLGVFFGFFWLHFMYDRTVRALQGRGIDIRAKVSATAEGLAVNGRLRVPASALRAGFVVPDASRGPFVLLERRVLWPLKLRMGTVRDARDLLRALRLDSSQKAVTRRVLCGTLTIGVDGIACSGAGGQEFFVSSTEVKEVSTYRLDGASVHIPGAGSNGGGSSVRVLRAERGVDLALHDGRSVRIPVTSVDDDSLLELIEERIRECIDLSRRGDVLDGTPEPLHRKGRPVEAWLRALRAIGAGSNADHRNAPVSTEKLWQIVESASSNQGDRVVAAATLGASEADVNRDRLRILAQSTASPKMRVALGAAAEQDEEVLLESLAAIDNGRSTRKEGQ